MFVVNSTLSNSFSAKTQTTTRSTAATITKPQAHNLGVVSKCTLTGMVKNFNVLGRSYCVVDKGNYPYPVAFGICKVLNARLPLPRNKNEADEFLKISSAWTHVDARNPKKTANKAEWIDAEGKPLGNRPVYARGQHYSIQNLYFYTLIGPCKNLNL